MDQTLGTGIDYAVIVLYFTAILGFGALFGRYARSTQDFFFAGQRFPWWLIAVSLVATLVGSYSFIKYSKKAYEYGFSSSYAYLNDPGWTPLFILVWLPLIYYARIASVPEYMERRFGTSARLAATFIMLVYMVGYIGFNLYTIGVGMQGMLGMDPLLAAVLVGIVCAVYVTAGGQTSVVMTDLIQGFILLLAGVGLLVLGIAAVGGFDEFWRLLGPVNGLAEQRRALPPFNSPRDFNFVGIFWQDGMANNLAALLINQGMIMRFLAARSVRHGQKAAVAMAVVLVPVAAIAVSGGGWIGSAMTRAGLLNDADSAQIFVVVADTLCGPGLFGLMMAALIAALMSTADTLINATAAVVVNDVWRPYVQPGRPDRYYLTVARYVSIAAALLGIVMVPLFMQFDLYEAHGAFTACVTPPLAVALLIGLCWPRAGKKSALAALLGGSLSVAMTLVYPSLLVPVSLAVGGGGEPSNYMRAAFGLAVSTVFGLVAGWLSKGPTAEQLDGLTAFSVARAKEKYKGSKPRKGPAVTVPASLEVEDSLQEDAQDPFPAVRVGSRLAEKLQVQPGDLIFIGHRNPIISVVRAVRARVADIGGRGSAVALSPRGLDASGLTAGQQVAVEFEM